MFGILFLLFFVVVTISRLHANICVGIRKLDAHSFLSVFVALLLCYSALCYFNFNYNCVLCALHFLNLLLYRLFSFSLICTPLQSKQALRTFRLAFVLFPLFGYKFYFCYFVVVLLSLSLSSPSSLMSFFRRICCRRRRCCCCCCNERRATAKNKSRMECRL